MGAACKLRLQQYRRYVGLHNVQFTACCAHERWPHLKMPAIECVFLPACRTAYIHTLNRRGVLGGKKKEAHERYRYTCTYAVNRVGSCKMHIQVKSVTQDVAVATPIKMHLLPAVYTLRGKGLLNRLCGAVCRACFFL